jgi:hypothetical protein
MKNEQTTVKTVLFLYEVACIGLQKGEEARFYMQFYDSSWQEALAHAEYNLNLYAVQRLSDWEIKSIQTLYFN